MSKALSTSTCTSLALRDDVSHHILLCILACLSWHSPLHVWLLCLPWDNLVSWSSKWHITVSHRALRWSTWRFLTGSFLMNYINPWMLQPWFFVTMSAQFSWPLIGPNISVPITSRFTYTLFEKRCLLFRFEFFICQLLISMPTLCKKIFLRDCSLVFCPIYASIHAMHKLRGRCQSMYFV
jgi:hypothetical protein